MAGIVLPEKGYVFIWRMACKAQNIWLDGLSLVICLLKKVTTFEGNNSQQKTRAHIKTGTSASFTFCNDYHPTLFYPSFSSAEQFLFMSAFEIFPEELQRREVFFRFTFVSSMSWGRNENIIMLGMRLKSKEKIFTACARLAFTEFSTVISYFLPFYSRSRVTKSDFQ